jgi:hypothetical protein
MPHPWETKGGAFLCPDFSPRRGRGREVVHSINYLIVTWSDVMKPIFSSLARLASPLRRNGLADAPLAFFEMQSRVPYAAFTGESSHALERVTAAPGDWLYSRP